jgi:hypothetical protein
MFKDFFDSVSETKLAFFPYPIVPSFVFIENGYLITRCSFLCIFQIFYGHSCADSKSFQVGVPRLGRFVAISGVSLA